MGPMASTVTGAKGAELRIAAGMIMLLVRAAAMESDGTPQSRHPAAFGGAGALSPCASERGATAQGRPRACQRVGMRQHRQPGVGRRAARAHTMMEARGEQQFEFSMIPASPNFNGASPCVVSCVSCHTRRHTNTHTHTRTHTHKLRAGNEERDRGLEAARGRPQRLDS